MKWYWFQIYILWPTSIVFYAFIYFMSAISADGINVSDIRIDTSNAETFINYLIPINILHSLLLIYLFHSKSHLSLKFLIVSNIILVISSYLFFGIPIDVFYIIPYLVCNFIYYNKRKNIFIHWIEKSSVSHDDFCLFTDNEAQNNNHRNIVFEVFRFICSKDSEQKDLNLSPPQPHCGQGE